MKNKQTTTTGMDNFQAYWSNETFVNSPNFGKAFADKTTSTTNPCMEVYGKVDYQNIFGIETNDVLKILHLLDEDHLIEVAKTFMEKGKVKEYIATLLTKVAKEKGYGRLALMVL